MRSLSYSFMRFVSRGSLFVSSVHPRFASEKPNHETHETHEKRKAPVTRSLFYFYFLLLTFTYLSAIGTYF